MTPLRPGRQAGVMARKSSISGASRRAAAAMSGAVGSPSIRTSVQPSSWGASITCMPQSEVSSRAGASNVRPGLSTTMSLSRVVSRSLEVSAMAEGWRGSRRNTTSALRAWGWMNLWPSAVRRSMESMTFSRD